MTAKTESVIFVINVKQKNEKLEKKSNFLSAMGGSLLFGLVPSSLGLA